MKTQKLNIKVRDLTPLLGKSRKTMIEGRNLMKNITLIMCFIAALAIFVLPVDAATRVKQSIPITLSVPVVCNVGEVVDLSGRLHAVITFRRLPFLSAHVDVNTQGVAGTGEITGRTYQGNGTIHTISLGSPLLNGQATLSTRVAFLVTGAPGPDGSVPSFDLQAEANGPIQITFAFQSLKT